MNEFITDHRKGFAPGWTIITRHDDPQEPTGLGISVLKLAAAERYQETAPAETAFLLMSGSVWVIVNGEKTRLTRSSLFDESPSAVHMPAGAEIELDSDTPTELTVYRTHNPERFAARVYHPADTPDEPRGKGQVGGACLRLVRTIFDGTIADPASRLVLGEVVTLPGRWSSYPPHHHAQPEIYHYRFSHEQGFGHAELGEAVYKVRNYDTIRILAGNDHAQCAAPGYAMYYSWVIRHLPGNPYTMPEFTEAHRWTMERDAKIWMPRDLSDA